MKKNIYLSPEAEEIEMECTPLLTESLLDELLEPEGESIGDDSNGTDY